MPKLFENVLEARIESWAERVGLLSDLQGGFRPGRSTVDQIFCLKEITSLRREQNRATFLGFIDAACAYDTVHTKESIKKFPGLRP